MPRLARLIYIPELPKLFCRLLICIFVATATSAQQPAAPEPEPGTVVGTVVDLTGRVIPGASVVLEGASKDDQRRVVTRDNGFFSLDGVESGTHYRITVSSEGFANWTSGEVIVKPGQYLIVSNITLRVATVQQAITVAPSDEVALQQVKAAEEQRIVGVIPNFYVVYAQSVAPLPPKLKFHLATKFLTDPVANLGFFLNAAIYQMAGYPSYQQGAKGYGQRLGATYVGGYTNILVGDAILPSLLHQDPRYFYQGTGTTKSRLMHALSTPFVVRTDNGWHQINFSDIGGDLASGAIANAYYPDKDRGAQLVLKSALIGAGGRMANAVVQEFLLHKFTSRRAKPTP